MFQSMHSQGPWPSPTTVAIATHVHRLPKAHKSDDSGSSISLKAKRNGGGRAKGAGANANDGAMDENAGVMAHDRDGNGDVADPAESSPTCNASNPEANIDMDQHAGHEGSNALVKSEDGPPKGSAVSDGKASTNVKFRPSCCPKPRFVD